MEMYTRLAHARTFHYIYLGRGDVSIPPPLSRPEPTVAILTGERRKRARLLIGDRWFPTLNARRVGIIIITIWSMNDACLCAMLIADIAVRARQTDATEM